MQADGTPGVKGEHFSESKRFVYIVIVLCVVACTIPFFIFAVSRVLQSDLGTKLVGSWQITVNGQRVTYNYSKDHSWVMTFDGEKPKSQIGNWEIKGKVLVVTTRSNNFDGVLKSASGRPESLIISELSESKLVLEVKDRDNASKTVAVRTLTRIVEPRP